MKEKFPGFKKCMEMMRSRDPGISEDGFAKFHPTSLLSNLGFVWLECSAV